MGATLPPNPGWVVRLYKTIKFPRLWMKFLPPFPSTRCEDEREKLTQEAAIASHQSPPAAAGEE